MSSPDSYTRCLVCGTLNDGGSICSDTCGQLHEADQRAKRLDGQSCDCGEPATREWDEGADFAFWTKHPRLTPVCADCWTKRDNAEPPDPDGEAFRGGEAAAFQQEQLATLRRLR